MEEKRSSGLGVFGNGFAQDSQGTSGGGIPSWFTNPGLLHCQICLVALSSPIYACEMGHMACSSCIGKKCPCLLPIVPIRCKDVEKLIGSIKVECKYKSLGCNETMSYHQKDEHINKCPHSTGLYTCQKESFSTKAHSPY